MKFSEDHFDGGRAGRNYRLVIAALVVAVAVTLVAVRYISAAEDQTDGRPVPPAGAAQEPSTFADKVPTTAELMAAPPSIERYVAAHTLPAGVLAPANLDGSTKTASEESVSPGAIFSYTILIPNDGEVDIPATMTDQLPADVEFIDVECSALITDECDEDGGTVTWEGLAAEGATVEIVITVRLSLDATQNEEIVNTAEIETVEDTYEREATITVAENRTSPLSFLPFSIVQPPPDPQPVTLSASQPNGANEWTVTWTTSPGASSYDVEESNSPDFNGVMPYSVDDATSLTLRKTPGYNNIFYYRARSRVGNLTGPWSNVVQVVGGFRDDFNTNTSGWDQAGGFSPLRRTTYMEEVRGFYETQDSWYVIQIDDAWDWGIASPGKPAPRVPYVIEFDVRPANLANLLSFGFVFGGDWPSANCPMNTSTFDGIYRHADCFNHFYNTNTIYFGDLKMLFERVDQLVWCLDCGGSPMKRLGDIDPNSAEGLEGMNPEGWNSFRIEVRQEGIKIFAASRGTPLRLQDEYSDTRWIGSPYFGVFASTDEYSNSTWRYDFVQVLPLD